MQRLTAWFRGFLRRIDPAPHLELEAVRLRNDQLREVVRGIMYAEAEEKRDRASLAYERAVELADAQAMGPGGLTLSRSQESFRRSVDVNLKERFWELELALEDRGWKHQLAISQTEFSRYGLQQIILICRLYFIKNPLVKRGVKVCAAYVFGRGFDIMSDDEAANEVIQAFLTANAKELGHSGLVEKEESLHTDGNQFFIFFTDKSSGETKIRTIDATEIQDIITNPDDQGEPWYFKRTWMQSNFDDTGIHQNKQMTAWYPALGATIEQTFSTIASDLVMEETPILHVKGGGIPKWHFGCPDVYTAIDWSRAYQRFLEDWCTLNRALARFAWNVETKGGAQAIQQFSKVLSTTLGNSGTSIETNPTPVVGSAFITGEGNKLSPIDTGSKQGNPEQGRRMLLMVAAAFGIPETFFGDASTGSLATAKSLDRPTELKFMERQQQWRETLTTICQFVLDRSVKAPSGQLKIAAPEKDKPKITVTFPAILEHDVGEMVSAIINATTLGGFQPAGTVDFKVACIKLMNEIGIENPEELFEVMYPSYEPKIGDGTAQAATTVDDGTDPQASPRSPRLPTMNQEARLAGAVSQLRRAADLMEARAKNGHA